MISAGRMIGGREPGPPARLRAPPGVFNGGGIPGLSARRKVSSKLHQGRGGMADRACAGVVRTVAVQASPLSNRDDLASRSCVYGVHSFPLLVQLQLKLFFKDFDGPRLVAAEARQTPILRLDQELSEILTRELNSME
jgi:hypothetical protein